MHDVKAINEVIRALQEASERIAKANARGYHSADAVKADAIKHLERKLAEAYEIRRVYLKLHGFDANGQRS